MHHPARGEIWRVDLDPVLGHEQGGARPALIISNDIFNSSAAGLVVIVPATSKSRPIRSFLRIDPPEGGLKQTSFLICDQIRTISKGRLTKRMGAITAPVLAEVEQRVKFLLDLT
jgi:mRNA interferase MazF